MELKEYQRRVVIEVKTYLDRLAKERNTGNSKHASLDAWGVTVEGVYQERRNALGEDVPNFTIKVPTGGGKTLIATQILADVYNSILKDRNGSGLVLWVVPSSQIYNDTLRRLKDRSDLYRLMLEHAVSRRIELWEKHDLNRLTPAQLRDALNILVIQLASTNRTTKEQLKFFRDSGGNVVQHFPPEDDLPRHAELLARTPNLSLLEDASGRTSLVATSIANLVRLQRPAVILDEGHKATSPLARQTLDDFNASVIVELSATPKKNANVLTRVSGQELLDEEMIKLPINVLTSGERSWQKVLGMAKDKRDELARLALDHAHASGDVRLVRPMVLVQVERTGKDQRDSAYIHSEDVKEYLTGKLGVDETAIAIKSASRDDIEGIDLLADSCPIQWIITKSALQEGWDNPYAYVLVSLMSTRNEQSMTQLVGRVLRQPFQKRMLFDELNQSYVYCLRENASDVAKQVKKALEKEGYEEGLASSVVTSGPSGSKPTRRTATIRARFQSLYAQYDGKIYLPRFGVRRDGTIRAFDYYRDLVSAIQPKAFEFDRIDWPLDRLIEASKDRYYQISLGTDLELIGEASSKPQESDEQVLSWLTANVGFDFFDFRQLGLIVEQVYQQLKPQGIDGNLALVKHELRDRLIRFVQEQTDIATEKRFNELFEAGSILFHLECRECRFEIPPSITLLPTRPMVHSDGQPVDKSLFDYVEDEAQNEYERAVALCLDRQADVLWWYRNQVGKDNFSVQGYRKARIHPDFVVQSGSPEHIENRVVVIESKGKHLEGNPDTRYKRAVADYFERAGQSVSWQQLGADFKGSVFRFQILDEAQPYGRHWRDELEDILAGSD